eukprot:TRINITY_DN8584_c0_g1_i1.p1 TRINITY_DN8584_c0_g1~~TRINITY_DN8584_c0_g1_i1.p1  ORF type:complete len:507 (+),score=68.05 TRINITY_DN8584_c0_g1_i1:1-1521(+)
MGNNKSSPNSNKNLKELTPQDIVLSQGSLLGHGLTCAVHIGTYKNEKVAVKILKDEVVDRLFQKEITMGSLHHPNIAQLIGYVNKPPNRWIILKYYEKGSLERWVHGNDLEWWSQPVLIKFAKDIAKALVFLHSNNHIHRDVKIENMLVNSFSLDDEVNLVLSDLGICRVIDVEMTQGAGTPIYMAPEVIQGNQYSENADVYSYGLFLWEIWSRARPFRDNLGDFPNVLLKGYRLPIPDTCPPAIKTIIQKTWQTASERPKASQILKQLESVDLSTFDLSAPASPSFISTSNVRYQIFEYLESITWEQLCEKLQQILKAKPNHLQSLQFVLEKDGKVELKLFEGLLKWFDPLIPESEINSVTIKDTSKLSTQSEIDSDYMEEVERLSNQEPNYSGYTVSYINKLVSKQWFHGFRTSSDVIEQLKTKEEGTFLVRFSTSKPGDFALGVTAKNGPVQFVIESCAQPRGFKIGKEFYESLYHIIYRHSMTPLSLNDGGNCMLKKPCSKV